MAYGWVFCAREPCPQPRIEGLFQSSTHRSVQRARGNVALCVVVGRRGPGGEGRGALSAWVAWRVTGPCLAGPHSPQLGCLVEFSGWLPHPRPSSFESQVRVRRVDDTGLGRREPGTGSGKAIPGGPVVVSPLALQPGLGCGRRRGPPVAQKLPTGGLRPWRLPRAGLGRGDPARVRTPGSCASP